MLIFQSVLSSPIGPVRLTFNHDYLKRVELFTQAECSRSKPPAVIAPIIERIKAYFEQPQSLLDLPYELTADSPFVQRVLEEMVNIPLGQTCTYGDLAKKLKTSARAVGNACKHNPLALVIPCHRVVAANGIGGFFSTRVGSPIDVKQWLLAHERKTC